MAAYTDEEIIEEVKASMRMAGMGLTEQDIQDLRDINDGKITEDEAVQKIIEEAKNEQRENN